MRFWYLLTLLFIPCLLNATRGDLTSYRKILTVSNEDLAGLVRQYNMSSLRVEKISLEVYKIQYETIDPKGNVSSASGIVAIPLGYNKPLSLLSYTHGSMCERQSVPSNLTFQFYLAVAAFSSGAYLLACPDYLGLGNSDLCYHPYCHAASLASCSLDMLKAARQLAKTKKVNLKEGVYITGYSEGGMAAMALHKELEQNPIASLKPLASAPMSGPYDLSNITLTSSLQNPSARTTTHTLYLLIAYNMLYNLMPSLDTVLIPPFSTLGSILLDGTHSFFLVNSLIPHDPSQVMQPAFFNTLIQKSPTPFKAALSQNNTYDWKPKAKMALIAVGQDKDVSFENTQFTYDWMKKEGCDVLIINAGEELDHITGQSPCHLEARKFFDSIP